MPSGRAQALQGEAFVRNRNFRAGGRQLLCACVRTYLFFNKDGVEPHRGAPGETNRGKQGRAGEHGQGIAPSSGVENAPSQQSVQPRACAQAADNERRQNRPKRLRGRERLGGSSSLDRSLQGCGRHRGLLSRARFLFLVGWKTFRDGRYFVRGSLRYQTGIVSHRTALLALQREPVAPRERQGDLVLMRVRLCAPIIEYQSMRAHTTK